MDPQRSTVSVLVPSYNHARFVGRCLNSVLGQSLPPDELIVIDDGSRDGSPSVIERVLENCPFRCELIVRPNRGLCATLNEGLERASGRYFAYLGSDDLWLPEFLRQRVRLLDARPDAVLAYGHFYIIDENDRTIGCTEKKVPYVDGCVKEMLLWKAAPLSTTMLYRREVLERHRWTEGARLEDYDLFLRLCTVGQFALDPRPLAAWRKHGHNTSLDNAMMMRERLSAVCASGAKLGLGPSELRAIMARLQYDAAGAFLRGAERGKALALTLRNLSAAPSPTALARRFLGLATPLWVMDWLDRRSYRQSSIAYGDLKIEPVPPAGRAGRRP